MTEINPNMTCLDATKTTLLSCGDVDGVRYCRKIIQEETICVPDGKDVWERLSIVLKGLSGLIKK
jgi:hypothetical protein